MKKCLLVGAFDPYPDAPDGAEIWGVNCTYRQQPNVTRVYAMDTLRWFIDNKDGFVKEINALDVPVYMQAKSPLIPRSRVFPREQMIDFFWGGSDEHACVSSTASYMFAHAIMEGYDEIQIHAILVGHLSVEYWAQKASLDFFYAAALAHKIKVTFSGGSQVGRPYPWQAKFYGYTPPYRDDTCDRIIADAFMKIYELMKKDDEMRERVHAIQVAAGLSPKPLKLRVRSLTKAQLAAEARSRVGDLAGRQLDVPV